jgi:hypothetical protein
VLGYNCSCAELLEKVTAFHRTPIRASTSTQDVTLFIPSRRPLSSQFLKTLEHRVIQESPLHRSVSTPILHHLMPGLIQHPIPNMYNTQFLLASKPSARASKPALLTLCNLWDNPLALLLVRMSMIVAKSEMSAGSNS